MMETDSFFYFSDSSLPFRKVNSYSLDIQLVLLMSFLFFKLCAAKNKNGLS